MDEKSRGVYGKYVIKKADGSPVDERACYFVLRLDKDEAARKAMRTYAKHCGNKQLAADIRGCLAELEKPACGCRSVGECFHDFMGLEALRVWRHGDPSWWDGLNPSEQIKSDGLNPSEQIKKRTF